MGPPPGLCDLSMEGTPGQGTRHQDPSPSHSGCLPEPLSNQRNLGLTLGVSNSADSRSSHPGWLCLVPVGERFSMQGLRGPVLGGAEPQLAGLLVPSFAHLSVMQTRLLLPGHRLYPHLVGSAWGLSKAQRQGLPCPETVPG